MTFYVIPNGTVRLGLGWVGLGLHVSPNESTTLNDRFHTYFLREMARARGQLCKAYDSYR